MAADALLGKLELGLHEGLQVASQSGEVLVLFERVCSGSHHLPTDSFSRLPVCSGKRIYPSCPAEITESFSALFDFNLPQLGQTIALPQLLSGWLLLGGGSFFNLRHLLLLRTAPI